MPKLQQTNFKYAQTTQNYQNKKQRKQPKTTLIIRNCKK